MEGVKGHIFSSLHGKATPYAMWKALTDLFQSSNDHTKLALKDKSSTNCAAMASPAIAPATFLFLFLCGQFYSEMPMFMTVKTLHLGQIQLLAFRLEF